MEMPEKKWEEREANLHSPPPPPVLFLFITSVFFFLLSSLLEHLEQGNKLVSTSTLKPATLAGHPQTLRTG